MVYLFALFLGGVAGLRALTPPAAVAWAAHLGWLELDGSRLAFLGNAWMPWVLTGLAGLELVADQLPSTPSRTTPPPFAARILSGALCGAALGVSRDVVWSGAAAGVIGAVLGTMGGEAFRARLASEFGRDRPAALVEDAIALGASVVLIWPLARALS